MKKRTLAMLLAAVMLSGLLAACGAGSAETAEASSGESASAQSAAPAENQTDEDTNEEPAAEAAVSAAEEEESLDETQTAAQMPEDYALPLYEEPVTLEIFYPIRSGNHPSKSDEKSVFWRRLEDNLLSLIHI